MFRDWSDYSTGFGFPKEVILYLIRSKKSFSFLGKNLPSMDIENYNYI